MMKEMLYAEVDIIFRIPEQDFNERQRDIFIQAVVALFKGMFPSARDTPDGPPITVTIGEEEKG